MLELLQHFFGMIVHDGIVEIESLEVVKRRDNDASRHRRLKLESEVHQLAFKEREEHLGVFVRKEIDVGRFVASDETLVRLFLSADDLVFTFEDPKFPVRA